MGRDLATILDELDDESLDSFLKRHPLLPSIQHVQFDPGANLCNVLIPDAVLTEAMGRALARSGRAILGRFIIDHESADWGPLEQAAFIVTDLSSDQGRGFATIKCLDTPRGQMLAKLLQSGLQVAWTVDATGSIRDGQMRDMDFHTLTAIVKNHPAAFRPPAPSRAEYERRMALCQGCAVGS
jgi:hypothetical protein